MQFKTFIFSVIIVTMMISNYYSFVEYNEEYVVENFNIYKLMDTRYRCYRIFTDGTNNSYNYNKCKVYIYDYKNFVLERNRFIFALCLQNVVIINLIIIFYVLL